MKSQSLFRRVLILLILIAGGVSVWWHFSSKDAVSGTGSQPAASATSIGSADSDGVDGVLNEGQEIENLFRLANSHKFKNEPAARAETLKQANEFAALASPPKRMAGLTILTRFTDDEALDTIISHFEELSTAERLQLIQILQTSMTPARQNWIVSLGADAATVSKVQSAHDDKQISIELKKLDSLSLDTQMAAVTSLSPTHFHAPQKKWLMRQALAATDARLQVVAINKLAELKIHDFANSLIGLSRRNDRSIRIAAIEAVPLLCPTDRWALLKERAKVESDLLVLRRLLDQLSYLRGSEAKSVVAMIKQKSSSFPKELLSKISETETDLEFTAVKNRCD